MRRPVVNSRVQREPEDHPDAVPQLWLTNRQNTAIIFLDRYHPEPQPTSVIPGVSDITMEELIGRNAVAEVQAPDGKERIFILLASGQDEVRRLALRERWRRQRAGQTL
ncbi:hypothetical protein [Rhizobium tubonense]|nr:hypothetical protein [Rhizobium tubonense]